MSETRKPTEADVIDAACGYIHGRSDNRQATYTHWRETYRAAFGAYPSWIHHGRIFPDQPTKADHEPMPVADFDVTLCATCFEKLRRTDNGWEHFGEDQPYEPYVIGDSDGQPGGDGVTGSTAPSGAGAGSSPADHHPSDVDGEGQR